MAQSARTFSFRKRPDSPEQQERRVLLEGLTKTRELIDQHLSTCVAEDLKNGGEEKLQEFLWILNKLV